MADKYLLTLAEGELDEDDGLTLEEHLFQIASDLGYTVVKPGLNLETKVVPTWEQKLQEVHLVTVTKTTEVEVKVAKAVDYLTAEKGYTLDYLGALATEAIVEAFVDEVEGNEMDLEFDRYIKVVTKLEDPHHGT